MAALHGIIQCGREKKLSTSLITRHQRNSLGLKVDYILRPIGRQFEVQEPDTRSDENPSAGMLKGYFGLSIITSSNDFAFLSVWDGSNNIHCTVMINVGILIYTVL